MRSEFDVVFHDLTIATVKRNDMGQVEWSPREICGSFFGSVVSSLRETGHFEAGHGNHISGLLAQNVNLLMLSIHGRNHRLVLGILGTTSLG